MSSFFKRVIPLRVSQRKEIAVKNRLTAILCRAVQYELQSIKKRTIQKKSFGGFLKVIRNRISLTRYTSLASSHMPDNLPLFCSKHGARRHTRHNHVYFSPQYFSSVSPHRMMVQSFASV